MDEERVTASAVLQSNMLAAAFRVHAITGKSEHTLTKICDLHPNHPDVIDFLEKERKRNDFLRGRA